MIKACLLAVLLLLAGCVSNSVTNIDYYLLDSVDVIPSVEQSKPSSLVVVLDDIRLANYLSQLNLAMQLTQHQLHYSKQHFWAEPLQNGIRKALLRDLNAADSSAAFVAARSAMADHRDMTIGIQVDHFVITHDSTVVMSGHYWFSSDSKADLSKQPHRFHFSTPLEQDGYPHSVSQLRMLINQLSVDIITTIQPLESS